MKLKHTVRPQMKSLFVIYGLLLAVFLIMVVISPTYRSAEKIGNIIVQCVPLAVVSLGQTVVMIGGGIDLSVGSMVTLTNVFAVSIMQGKDENILPAVAVCLLLGLLCGVVNGIGVLKLNIAPFVMTLCTMSILQGVYLVYTGGSPSGNVSPWLKQIGNGFLVGPIPYSTVIWLTLALLVWVVLKFTPYGRKLYAVGSNPKAARLCGIRVERIKFSTYILSSLLAVVAGLLASGYIGTTSLSLGNDYINNSLAAVLIGGNAIEGGKGGVWGCVLGAFFMMLLFALLTMLSIGQVGKLIVQGLIIFGVVAGQGVFKKER